MLSQTVKTAWWNISTRFFYPLMYMVQLFLVLSKSHLILDKYSHLNEKKLVHIFTGTIISLHTHVQCLKIDAIFYYIYFQLSRINLVNIHVMPSVVGWWQVCIDEGQDIQCDTWWHQISERDAAHAYSKVFCCQGGLILFLFSPLKISPTHSFSYAKKLN